MAMQDDEPATPELSVRRHRDSLEDNSSAPLYGMVASPPFQHLVRDLVCAVFRVDPARVMPHLPQGLRLAPNNTGLIFAYTAPSGWGLSPYSRVFACVTLDDYASPDTGEASFILCTIATHPASRTIRSLFHGDAADGEIDITVNAGDASVRAMVHGEPWIEIGFTADEPVSHFTAGSDRYLALTQAGLTAHDIAYAGDAANGKLTKLVFGESAPAALQAMEPTELLFGQHLPVFSGTWSAPWLMGREVEEATLDTYLGLLDGSGRAAAIAREDGTVLRANSLARRLLDVRDGGSFQLPVFSPTDRVSFGLRVREALSGGSVRDPFLIHVGHNANPLLVRVTTLDAASAMGNAVLLTLEAPTVKPARDVAPLLHLLGLTRAETRIALAVGQGLALSDAAEANGVTVGTARSTLKSIYAKLGISKQSELGSLVTRLQFV